MYNEFHKTPRIQSGRIYSILLILIMLIATVGINPANAAVVDQQAKAKVHHAAPVITGQKSLSTLEDTALTIVPANLIVSDPDNTYPTGFTLAVLSGTNYTFVDATITPALNFIGTLTVPVKVNNGTADSNVFDLAVSVTPANGVPVADSRIPPVERPNNNSVQGNQPNQTITISQANAAPVITGQNSLTTLEDTPLTIVLANLIVSDPDNTYPSGFTLTVLSGTNYTFVDTTITPALNFIGPLTVPVKVNNGTAESNVFDLTVSVTPANGVPVADSRTPSGKRPNGNGVESVEPYAITNPAPVAPSNGATGVSTSTTLTAHVSNSTGSNMTVSFYGRATNSVGAAFNLVALPDSQCYSGGPYNYDWCGSGGTPSIFYSQTKWIANNRAAQNIVFVTHLGDVTNDGDDNSTEWKVADTAMSYLENPATTGLPWGVPYGITPGNHDQTLDVGTTVEYNSHFGSSRFSGRSYYGGHYGSNNNNNYEFFSAGGMDFIIIHLENNPTSGAITWANNLLKTKSNLRAIVSSHDMLLPGNPAAFSSAGSNIYKGLKTNPNLFLMLCGHEDGTGQRTDTYSGNTINSLMSDYQYGTNGGNGWLRLMKFVPSLNQIQVQTYSPYTGKYHTTSDDQFNLSYRMGYALIGTSNNVPSNTDASKTWTGLTNNTQYDWYAVASVGVNSATSAIWNFTTGAQTLTVNKGGSGSGTVTSSPVGISCGSTCSFAFANNTPVTLTAAPTSPSTFGGWSGAGCPITGDCTITMSTAQSVTATFNPPGNQTLTVSNAGTGSGTVTSNPPGISCDPTCSYDFAYNTAVTLTATASTGSIFAGWSGGGCTGTGTCSVTMTAATSVMTNFAGITAQVFLPLVIR